MVVVDKRAARCDECAIACREQLSNVELAASPDENTITEDDRRSHHPVMIVIEKYIRLKNASLA
jgi:hypothetical protein